MTYSPVSKGAEINMRMQRLAAELAQQLYEGGSNDNSDGPKQTAVEYLRSSWGDKVGCTSALLYNA